MATTPGRIMSAMEWDGERRAEEQHTIVPDQERVLSQRHKGLTDSRGDRVREEVDTHNQTAHILRRFTVGKLEGRDTSTDFRKGNQAVRQSLHPDIDRCRAVDRLSCLILPRPVVDIVSGAGRHFVNVRLQHAGGHHGHGGNEKTHCDTLNRRKVDMGLAETGIDNVVENRNEDNQAVKIISVTKST